ncbi:MmgE/PrpD family protein, partial [Burkholderia sp. LMG 13014]
MLQNMNRRHFLSTLTSAAVAGALPLRTSAQTPASPDNLAHRLADYAASLRYEDLDAATIETVKAHFIDALGCAIAAHDEAP